jgi:tetratricopeptide (TPR) repeat protein
VSSDHEGAYYLGLALEADGLEANGDDRGARIQWEFAQQSGGYHAPAMMSLAALAARGGDRAGALAMVQEVLSNQPRLTRAGGMEIALLRALRRTADAKQRLLFWRRQDPASSFLAYEAMRLGDNDPDLLAHLAADPERIVEIASDYMRLGLYDDALDALGRQYPSGSNVVSEPGTARPDSYPLIAYYRGFCRFALGQDGRADFDAASRMRLTYVFPNRADSFAVLRHAIETNPHDASAHFLLGSLYLSGGETVRALREWQKANEINPSIPTLHRNMGYAVLLSGDSPRRAIELFREGMKYDPHNVDLYLGLEQAMQKADLPVSERIGALQSFPEMQLAPAVLIFRLVRLMGEAGEFDPAEKLLEKRFFPREEGGTNVREVYIQVKLNKARSAASQKQCASALEILQHLTDTVATLPFTTKGLEQFANSNSAEQAIQAIRSMCR